MIIDFNTENNIIQTSDGIYRFVNHKEKLLTTGYPKKETLVSYAMCIRDDAKTREIMTKRYNDNFSTSDNNDCTATADKQPKPKSPDGDFVQ